MRVKTLFALLLLAICVQSVPGFEITTCRSSAIGGNQLLSRPLPTDLLSIPAGGLGDRQWRVETGFARTFDISDLDQGLVAAAARRGRLTYSLGVSQFGQRDYYAEQTAKGAVMYTHDAISAGLTGSYYRVSFGGVYAPLAAKGFGGAIAWRQKRFAIALSGDNINTPSFYASALPFSAKYAAQIELISTSQFSTLGRATLQKMERPQFGLGQRIGIGSRHALMWGISTSPLIYGGGVELWFGRLNICYAANYHPTLGLSQFVTFTVGSLLFPKEKDTGVLNQ